MNTIELVRSLDPIAGNDPAAAVAEESRRDLCTRIGHSPIPAAPSPRRGRRRLVPLLVAAAVVAAATVTFVERPGGSRSEALGAALTFTSQGTSSTSASSTRTPTPRGTTRSSRSIT